MAGKIAGGEPDDQLCTPTLPLTGLSSKAPAFASPLSLLLFQQCLPRPQESGHDPVVQRVIECNVYSRVLGSVTRLVSLMVCTCFTYSDLRVHKRKRESERETGREREREAIPIKGSVPKAATSSIKKHNRLSLFASES